MLEAPFWLVSADSELSCPFCFCRPKILAMFCIQNIGQSPIIPKFLEDSGCKPRPQPLVQSFQYVRSYSQLHSKTLYLSRKGSWFEILVLDLMFPYNIPKLSCIIVELLLPILEHMCYLFCLLSFKALKYS